MKVRYHHRVFHACAFVCCIQCNRETTRGHGPTNKHMCSLIIYHAVCNTHSHCCVFFSCPDRLLSINECVALCVHSLILTAVSCFVCVQAAQHYESLGAVVEEVSLPSFRWAFVIIPSQCLQESRIELPVFQWPSFLLSYCKHRCTQLQAILSKYLKKQSLHVFTVWAFQRITCWL